MYAKKQVMQFRSFLPSIIGPDILGLPNSQKAFFSTDERISPKYHAEIPIMLKYDSPYILKACLPFPNFQITFEFPKIDG